MPRSTARNHFLSDERIQARFGSYGVDVLESDDRRRVSSLYSITDGDRVCRTYAQVTFAESIDPGFAAEHARVVAGESIGTVFQGAGWTIAKRHIHIGESMLPENTNEIARLMRIDRAQKLATHTYVFEVTKDGRSFDYAVITELHHPAYLSAADLEIIYERPETAT